jgi:hypothetical protein
MRISKAMAGALLAKGLEAAPSTAQCAPATKPSTKAGRMLRATKGSFGGFKGMAYRGALAWAAAVGAV